MANRDAIERLALERKVKLSASLEIQLEASDALQPMMAILGLAKEQAAAAMHGLIYVDPNNADKVREFQHEVRRYDDLVEWCHSIIISGREADNRLSQMDRQELTDLTLDPAVQAEADALTGERSQED